MNLMPIDRETLYAQIGKRLQKKRASLGMTQLDLARIVSLSRTSVANIEAGNQNAPVYVLYDICLALQLRPADLFPDIKEIESPIIIGDSIAAELGSKAATALRSYVRAPQEGAISESIDPENQG